MYVCINLRESICIYVCTHKRTKSTILIKVQVQTRFNAHSYLNMHKNILTYINYNVHLDLNICICTHTRKCLQTYNNMLIYLIIYTNKRI